MKELGFISVSNTSKRGSGNVRRRSRCPLALISRERHITLLCSHGARLRQQETRQKAGRQLFRCRMPLELIIWVVMAFLDEQNAEKQLNRRREEWPTA